MLNKLNKNIKSVIKQLPDNLSLINSKTVAYIGLAMYWGIILVGTFLNIIWLDIYQIDSNLTFLFKFLIIISACTLEFSINHLFVFSPPHTTPAI